MTTGPRLHDDALAALRAWAAPSPAQEGLRARYVAHLEEHPDGTDRACFPDHLTAGTVMLSADGREVLLNLHGKARRWFAFGGHIEPGDRTLADAARREAAEESGLDDFVFDPVPVHLDLHTVTFCDPRGPVRHLDVRYSAVAPHDAAHEVSEESLDVRWWPLDGLPTLEEEMHTLIGLARARHF
ncbi:MAG TPA: NUDIX domain-containing protein [Nocardioides sp.]|uniref:NUDIX domain-containing protein n=1 Tax=Nocardioides sp. TaxID=35761 RepID=UPI002D7FCD97|nr:NUDIX domain-containing protein [Nocardioides sp.]HET6651265.1 NUDIX domain-containing protein [Nocardioides sp.]